MRFGPPAIYVPTGLPTADGPPIVVAVTAAEAEAAIRLAAQSEDAFTPDHIVDGTGNDLLGSWDLVSQGATAKSVPTPWPGILGMWSQVDGASWLGGADAFDYDGSTAFANLLIAYIAKGSNGDAIWGNKNEPTFEGEGFCITANATVDGIGIGIEIGGDGGLLNVDTSGSPESNVGGQWLPLLLTWDPAVEYLNLWWGKESFELISDGGPVGDTTSDGLAGTHGVGNDATSKGEVIIARAYSFTGARALNLIKHAQRGFVAELRASLVSSGGGNPNFGPPVDV